MVNGNGIRVVLWVSGCEHGCRGCFNPETWNIDGGKEFTDSILNQLINYLSRDYVQGLTLTGGDPMHPLNRKDILFLVHEIKNKLPNKDIWMYTGYLYEEIKNDPILKHIDVLVDGPFIEEMKDEKHKWGGSVNQRVIDVVNSLKIGSICLLDV